MIVVTGATGKLGQLIVEKLSARIPANQIGVSVRDSSKATGLSNRGIRVRQSDFADPASLLHAFEGAGQVLVISSNNSGAGAVQHHRNAIDAARLAGAQRILYTSHMGANASSVFAPMRDHAATEEILKASGVAFTSLRNGFYASSAVMMMGLFGETGKVVAPADGPVSWTAHEDLADAAVLALSEEGKLDGITAPLTGAEALNLAQLAGLAAELTGRETTRITISDEEYHSSMLSHGTPEPMVDLFGGLYKASRANEFAAVDPTLGRLIGRPPVSMRQVLTDLIETRR
jgi:NAD(P)H dehydrogenase (quinone)